MTRPQKITFGEMRALGVCHVLIYCTDQRCRHVVAVPDDPDRWPDELTISDTDDRIVCTACGRRGADLRPDWRTPSRATARDKYLKELSVNPKWKDTTTSGGGFVIAGAKPFTRPK